jgi:hypothetical protein
MGGRWAGVWELGQPAGLSSRTIDRCGPRESTAVGGCAGQIRPKWRERGEGFYHFQILSLKLKYKYFESSKFLKLSQPSKILKLCAFKHSSKFRFRFIFQTTLNTSYSSLSRIL